MRPNAGELAFRFTATPRGLLNCKSAFVSLLIKVQPAAAVLRTTIWNDVAAPKAKLCRPLSSAPRSSVLPPGPNNTVTLHADSLRTNETVPALLLTAEAYGVARRRGAASNNAETASTRVFANDFFICFGFIDRKHSPRWWDKDRNAVPPGQGEGARSADFSFIR